MQKLQEALQSYDTHLLQIIANRWDVDIDTKAPRQAAKQLAAAMLDSAHIAAEWERLQDHERGALQMLSAAPAGKMTRSKFERLYGQIRQVGPDKRKREKHHLEPNGPGEILHFRGLLYLGFDEGKTGVEPFVYIPSDLAKLLPTHHAGYDLSEDAITAEDTLPALDDADPMMAALSPDEDPAHLHRTDTSLIDDITTLLAYVQSARVVLDRGYMPESVQQEILQSFIGSKSERRMAFILYLLVEMGLLANINEELQTVRERVKPWLDAPRTAQMKQLVDAWHNSTTYNELWHIGTLIPEAGAWQNDPRLLRNTLQETIQVMVSDGWAATDGLIELLKESEPDFQRPGGDYTSWYIRDATSGDYLNGFESWDHVEGVMLRFALTGPMFWLAMLDLGTDTPDADPQAASAFKLTAFGRAWVGRVPWPDVRDPEGQVTIHPDGSIEASRAISRYDRFQLARFTSWESVGNTYRYRLTGDSLRRAAEQGIQAQHVQAFLQRVASTPLPESLKTMLGSAREDGEASVMLEQLVVLSLDTPEMAQTIWQTPETRRFLARKLGPQTLAVRSDQWQGLLAELQKMGILVDNRMG
jgi:hypothetical protein